LTKELEVLYNKDKGAIVPTQGREDDYAFDVYTTEGTLIPPLTFKSVKLDTGLRTAFDPTEYGMKVSLRSGVAYKTPLIVTNSPGIVEGSYRDNIGILVRNTFIDNRLVDFAYNIKGERIKVSDIPKYVLKKALKFYEEETELLGYPDVTPEVKEQLYKTIVPAGTIYIAKHERPAQIHFQERVKVTFKEGSLPNSERGTGGFGSSGTSK